MFDIKRGEIYWTELEPVVGSEQGKTRPCVILQNNKGNLYSNTTIVAPLTSKINTKNFPVHVFLDKSDSGLKRDTLVLLSHIRSIDKSRIESKVGKKLSEENMRIISDAIKISLDLE